MVDPEGDGAMELWIGACVLSLVGSVLGIVSVVRLQFKDRRLIRGTGISGIAILLGLLSPVASLFLGLLTLGLNFSSGRPLRRGGRARLPSPGPENGWVEDLRLSVKAPRAVADGWRANAAMEAASVAAFAHLSNELLAVGAPAHLLEKAHADALDELRHARLCYGLAAAMDGQAAGPAPFPAAVLPRDRRLDVASLAADCIIESCLLESASARVAAALASHADVPAEIRSVLDTITADEARHAAHGWEIVTWCREAGDDSVDAAMRQALARVAPSVATAPVDHDEWERWGIAGPTLWRRCLTQVLAELHARLGDAPAHSRAA
jgi:hypothetical protein